MITAYNEIFIAFYKFFLFMSFYNAFILATTTNIYNEKRKKIIVL